MVEPTEGGPKAGAKATEQEATPSPRRRLRAPGRRRMPMISSVKWTASPSKQAVREFEIANARVVDLTQRLISANSGPPTPEVIVDRNGPRGPAQSSSGSERPSRRADGLTGLSAGSTSRPSETCSEVGVPTPRLPLRDHCLQRSIGRPRASIPRRPSRPTVDVDVLVLDDCQP